MGAGQQGPTSSAKHTAAVLSALVCVVGCADTAWTIPMPLVRAGSPIVYLKTRSQTQSVTRSWKDWSVRTVINETRYRAIDLRTCAKVGDFTFPGAVRELAWDAPAEDLWVALDSTPATARSMHGRAITLPPGVYLPELHPNQLPSTRIFREEKSGVVWLWRVHTESTEIIARNAPPIEAVVYAATRTVAIMGSGAGDELELLIVDEIPDATYVATRRRLRVPGTAGYSATLLQGGAAIAFLTSEGLEVFDIASGRRTAWYPRPVESSAVWGSSSPPTLAFATYDRDINQAGCSAHITTIEVERGLTSARTSTFAACFASLSWTGSQLLVAATQSLTGTRRRWLLDVASNWWVSAPERAENWHGFGKTLVFDDGPSGSRHLAMASPSSTRIEPVTSDLGDVRFMAADPVSRTAIVTAAPDELFLYRVDSRHLDHCKNL